MELVVKHRAEESGPLEPTGWFSGKYEEPLEWWN